jgi:hypothetical protein
MKPPAMRQILRTYRYFTGVCLLLAFSSSATAVGLTNGRYHFATKFAPICFDGTYPYFIGPIPAGVITLAISPDGQVNGKIELRQKTSNAKGKFLTKQTAVMLTLQATNENKPLRMTGQLFGTNFIGLVKTGRSGVPWRLDTSFFNPLLVTFDVTLSVDARGRVTGTGTASGCNTNFPITVTGSSKPTKCSIVIRGPKGFRWTAKGPSIEDGFMAQWQAKGFGSTLKGKGLAIRPQPLN